MPEYSLSAQRPTAVTAIAVTFSLVASYLILIAGMMFISPGAVSMTAGSALLSGLELAGPFMFLLMGAVGGAIGFGLLKLNNWARRGAIIAALLGTVMLIPSVSAAAVDFRPGLLWSGLGVVVRVVIVWYLYQSPVTEAFLKKPIIV